MRTSSQASCICSTSAQLTSQAHLYALLLLASTAHHAICAVHVRDDFTKSIVLFTDMHSHMHQVRSPVYNVASMQYQISASLTEPLCKNRQWHAGSNRRSSIRSTKAAGAV